MQFARKGPVRVTGIATFNENLEPTEIEVKSAHPIQAELPLGSDS